MRVPNIVNLRYERFWLPLLQHYSRSTKEDLTLEPPDDVKWAWHVHLLAPNAYSQDLNESVLARVPAFTLKPDTHNQRRKGRTQFTNKEDQMF